MVHSPKDTSPGSGAGDMVIITEKAEKQYASLYRMLKWWWVCDKMMITRFYGGLEGVST